MPSDEVALGRSHFSHSSPQDRFTPLFSFGRCSYASWCCSDACENPPSLDRCSVCAGHRRRSTSRRYPKPLSRPLGAAVTLVHYGTTSTRELRLYSTEKLDLQAGDPVFAKSKASWRLVGRVSSLSETREGMEYRVAWRAKDLQPIGTFSYGETPQSFAWVAQTLLPVEKRERLLSSLRRKFSAHREILARELEPVLVQSFHDVSPLLQQRLRDSLQHQEARIQSLGDRYRLELVEQRLLPLIQSEVLPIVEMRSKPVMQKIGGELFERASVWRFTWRYLYDVSPLPQRDLVQGEFNRFVSKEVIPVLESHAEEILATMKDVALDIGKNEKVKQTVREAAAQLFRDPEMRDLVSDVFRETFSDSKAFAEILRKNWEAEAGQRFATSLEATLDPWLREVGAELFGTPDEGLSREFVAILRSQILAKDQRWLTVSAEDRRGSSQPTTSPSHIEKSQEMPLFPTLRSDTAEPLLMDGSRR